MRELPIFWPINIGPIVLRACDARHPAAALRTRSCDRYGALMARLIGLISIGLMFGQQLKAAVPPWCPLLVDRLRGRVCPALFCLVPTPLNPHSRNNLLRLYPAPPLTVVRSGAAGGSLDRPAALDRVPVSLPPIADFCRSMCRFFCH